MSTGLFSPVGSVLFLVPDLERSMSLVFGSAEPDGINAGSMIVFKNLKSDS